MAEKNLDFDTVYERKNTNSLKYDFAKRRGMPEGLLSMWVADMDFKTSSYIQEAIVTQAEHGIYGYSETKEEYFEIVKSWMARRYNWKVDIRWLVKTPGIVFALAMAVKAYTEPGEAVMIQQPVYYPFSEVILDNGRRLIDNTLKQDETGKYQIDFEDLEAKIIQEKVKLFFLCNPHNPVGRAWTKEELERLGNICQRYGVIVVSDEIHADFTYDGRHLVFETIKPEFADFTITCTSPTKTFNIAALQISNIFIANRSLRHKFKKQVAAAGYSQVNGVGIVACEAAYQYGEEWLDGVLDYLRGNIQFVKDYIREKIPQIKMIEPEATYLVWLDFRGLKISNTELEQLIINKAGLWLDSGAIFGPAGEGFQRINVACPRKTLEEALQRIEIAVKQL